MKNPTVWQAPSSRQEAEGRAMRTTDQQRSTKKEKFPTGVRAEAEAQAQAEFDGVHCRVHRKQPLSFLHHRATHKNFSLDQRSGALRFEA